MKKGFTLVELLAVIIILGIIALVAVPIISDVLDSAKKDSAKASTLNFIEAAELHLSKYVLQEGKINDGTYTINEFKTIIGVDKISQNEPENKSKLIIQDNKIVNYNIVTDGCMVTKENNKVVVTEYNPPACERQTGTSGVYAYGDMFKCDLGDGIDRYFYVYDYSDANTITFLADRNYARVDGGYNASEAYAEGLISNFPKAISTGLPNANHIAKNIMGVSDYEVSWTLNWTEQAHDSEGYSIYWWIFDYINGCAGCKHPGDETEMGNQYILEDVNTGDHFVHVRQYNICWAGFWYDAVRPIVTVSRTEING